MKEDIYAHASVPPKGDFLHFNDIYEWNDHDFLLSTAIHEIGHFLGLSHSTVPSAVMNAYSNKTTILAQDDVEGIQVCCLSFTKVHKNDSAYLNDIL